MPKPDHLEQTVGRISKAQGSFYAAALGDALGWPNEKPSRRIDRKTSFDNEPASLHDWSRRAGDRFHPYEEVIRAGEYSDDTQLLLCTARSLTFGKEWWQQLTQRELPTWTLYERGGGRATKQAISCWLRGKPPWSDQSKASREYFSAGGNGVAMRIMPHCVAHSSENDFDAVKREIIENGIATHGHPRSLVGALAYGYALWRAFRMDETLPYGHLIELLLSEQQQWSPLDDSTTVLSSWTSIADESFDGRFRELWDDTVLETRRLLERCQHAIKQGALSNHTEVLTSLGCFDQKINGAGTISASAAVFLASQYAADPYHGIVAAASAHGADTDTIASMTGAILGAISGCEWIESRISKIQDAEYLRRLAEKVLRREAFDGISESPQPVDVSQRNREIVSKLAHLRPSETLTLPDSREAALVSRQKLASKNSDVSLFKLMTKDGQTLYVRSQVTGKQRDFGSSQSRDVSLPKKHENRVGITVGVKLIVSDIGRSKRFYGDTLGLRVARESHSLVNYANVIALVPADYAWELTAFESQSGTQFKQRSIVFIETDAIDEKFERVKLSGAKIIGPLALRNGRRFFRSFDPDGNIVEIFGTVPSESNLFESP